ncbi:MAG: hypothetical protein JWR09_4770 [Mucilaginibacter sp.]|nr:hypothetical protein [Mucilaginibacter sp.]
MKKIYSIIKSVIIPVIALFLTTSCKKTDYLNINAADRAPLVAHISFVNALNTNGGVQFWTYITQVTKTLVPLNGYTPYLDAQYGDVQINVTQGTNTSYIASREFGNSATFTATGGPNGPIATYYHTVFAIKNAKATADSLILFYDDLTAPASGKAKVRFVNLASGTPAVDFGITGQTNALFTNTAYGRAGGSVLSGSGLNAFSLGPFISVDAGTVSFSVLKTNNQSAITLVNDPLKNITLQAGKIYTIYINGTPGSADISATIITHN